MEQIQRKVMQINVIAVCIAAWSNVLLLFLQVLAVDYHPPSSSPLLYIREQIIPYPIRISKQIPWASWDIGLHQITTTIHNPPHPLQGLILYGLKISGLKHAHQKWIRIPPLSAKLCHVHTRFFIMSFIKAIGVCKQCVAI